MLVSDAHGGFGGIARHNCDVLDALSGSGAVESVTVLARLVNGSTGDLPSKVRYELTSTFGIAAFVATGLRQAFTGGRYDLIHCGHINLIPVASMIASIRRIPISLVIHGVEAWQPPENLTARRYLSRASLVVSVSELTAGRFRAWSGYSADETVVIPNTVQSGVFAPGPRDPGLVRDLGLEARTVIMSLGRMSSAERQKGFDEVIEAMPRLRAQRPDIVYLACGDGEDRPRLEAKAAALGVSDAVRFTGLVPEQRKADYFRCCDAFVMASSGEGFGIVLLEAMMCGIPVLASTLDGSREAVLGGKLGMVADPRDPDALVAGILVAVDRPKGVPPGMDHFAPSRFAERWVAAFQRTAAIPPNRRRAIRPNGNDGSAAKIQRAQ